VSLELFFRLPIEIQVHLASATICLLLGAYMMWGKKGTKQHKILGWTWVVFMAITAASAAFIHGIRIIGPFSPIHIFVPITFWGLYEGITHARAKKVKAHRDAMRSLYWAALCIPFAFALAPTRILTHMLGITDLVWLSTIITAIIL
jgi:uncharacterized membrane protein